MYKQPITRHITLLSRFHFYITILIRKEIYRMENQETLTKENEDNKSAFDVLQEQNKKLMERLEALEKEAKEKDNTIKRMLLEGNESKKNEELSPVDIITRDIIKNLKLKEKRN